MAIAGVPQAILNRCPSCQGAVEETAEICPHCRSKVSLALDIPEVENANKISEHEDQNKRNLDFKRSLYVGLIVVGAVAILILIVSRSY